MKRACLILAAVLILLGLSFTASSHSGKTDGNGGHTDHSTGDYHYHHGYPAHDHYDMDGDGDLDCPYDFDDKTGQNSGLHTSSNSGYSNGYADGESDGYDRGYDDGYDKGYSKGSLDGSREAKAAFETEKIAAVRAERELTYTLCGVYGIPLVVFLTYLVVRRTQKKRNSYLKKQIATLQSDLVRERNNTILDSLFPNSDHVPIIPPNVSLCAKFIPISGTAYKFRPYGDYTVYTTHKGSKYHARYNCGNANKPLHYFDIASELEPCRNCVNQGQYPKDIPQWYRDINMKSLVITPPVSTHTENEKYSETRKSTKTSPAKNSSGVVPVESSFISSVEYCNNAIYFTLKDGEKYCYYNVPYQVYSELLNASSKGRFFHQHIEGKYPYTPLG